MLGIRVRRAVCVLGVVGAASALVGCSTGVAAPGASTSASAAKAIKTITFVNPLPDFPGWAKVSSCMKDEAEKKGLTFTQSGPTGTNIDTQYMLDRMQQAIADKIDAIVTFPVSAEQFDPIFLQAKNAGIPTATILGGQTKNNTVNVGTSFAEYGEQAAATVAKKGKGQSVGFITEGQSGPPQAFVDGFKKYVAAHPDAGITIADTRYDAGDSTKDQALASAMLTAHPDLDMFVTNEGAATQPLVATLEAKQLKGKVYITTSSIYGGSVEGMKAGYVYAIGLEDFCGMGAQAVDSLISVSKGEKVDKDVYSEVKWATKESLSELTTTARFQ